MLDKSKNPIFSIFGKSICHQTPIQTAAAEMRTLSAEEIRTVAGGPEVEVGTGL